MALVVIALAAGLWSQENLAGISLSADVALSRPWQDMFFHATQIALFASSDGGHHLGNPTLAGQPVTFYHYGGYMSASLLCRVSGVDAYTLAISWWGPMGMLLTGLGAWVLGCSLLGRMGGIGAVLVALVLPDPSFYGVGNRWTSYFFFQTVGIGGSYAVAVLAQAWSLLFAAVRADDRRLAVAACLFGGLCFLFKAQVFLAYSCGLLLFAVVFLPGVRVHTKAVLLALCAVAARPVVIFAA